MKKTIIIAFLSIVAASLLFGSCHQPHAGKGTPASSVSSAPRFFD